MANPRLSLLRIVARVHPAIWDIIGDTHGPQPQPWVSDQSPWVFGNPVPWARGPQPEPWRAVEAWRLQSQLAVVSLTRRIADGASGVAMQGGNPADFLRLTYDDWGLEGRPPTLKLPPGWWHLVPPPPPPRPEESDLDTTLELLAVLGAAAASFAALSERVRQQDVSDALGEVAVHVQDVAARTLEEVG